MNPRQGLDGGNLGLERSWGVWKTILGKINLYPYYLLLDLFVYRLTIYGHVPSTRFTIPVPRYHSDVVLFIPEV